MNTNQNILLILERLDSIDARLDHIESYVKRAENAADAANNAAQTSRSAFDSISARIEILRTEHVSNHPQLESNVPPMLHTKKSGPV